MRRLFFIFFLIFSTLDVDVLSASAVGAEGNYVLNIKTMGEKFTINLTGPGLLVRDIYNEIANVIEIPIARLRVVFQGQKLDNPTIALNELFGAPAGEFTINLVVRGLRADFETEEERVRLWQDKAYRQIIQGLEAATAAFNGYMRMMRGGLNKLTEHDESGEMLAELLGKIDELNEAKQRFMQAEDE